MIKHTKRSLSMIDVRELRKAHASGTAVSVLATKYSLGLSAVYRIVNRETYKEIM